MVAKTPKRKSRITVPPRVNEYVTLGKKIKYLRAKMKPVMTQVQLADRAGVDIQTIWRVENDWPKAANMQLNTIKKIAHALDCHVFINFRKRSESKPSRAEGEFQLLYPEAQPLPERPYKVSGRALYRALSNVRSYQKSYRRRPYHEQHKATSGNRDLGLPEETKDE